MALTAFTERLGVSQGRLPGGAEGEWEFVLGDREPGWRAELVPGDRVEVIQNVDLTGVTLVRVRLRLRVPEGTPSGLEWEASLTVDGIPKATIKGRPGQERKTTDLAAVTASLTGSHAVGVRLELVAP